MTARPPVPASGGGAHDHGSGHHRRTVCRECRGRGGGGRHVERFFPTVSRPDTLGGITGGALVGLLSASALALGLTALWTAIDVLSWTVIVICGGMGILIAPMVFEGLPRGFCDSRPGVLTLTGIASLLLVLVLGVTTY